MDIWGRVAYPGAVSVEAMTYTASHGITPGVAVLTIHPQDSPPAVVGNLTITDGPGTVVVQEMRLDKIRSDIGPSGQIWYCELLDRRWRWRDAGAISGSYNQLDPHGKLIPWTIRSPYELCILCLRALGEARFVIDMPPGLTSAAGANLNSFFGVGQNVAPSGVNPPVVWDAVNPAAALQGLADLFGRRVVYDPVSNIVMIARPGFGQGLPAGHLGSASPAVDYPEVPAGVMVAGDPTRYDARLELEAVGEEWDGSYKPIAALSYAPQLDAKNQITTITVTAATTGIVHFYLDFVDHGVNLFVQGTSGIAASAVASDFNSQINAHPLLLKILTATVAGNVITLTGRNETMRFEPAGRAEIVGTGTGTPALVASTTQVGRRAGKGWDMATPPLFPGVRTTERLTLEQARALAQKSVWKCYRLTGRDGTRNGLATIPWFGRIARVQQIVLTPTRVRQVVPAPPDFTLRDRLGQPVVLNLYNGYSRDEPASVYGAVAATINSANFFRLDLQSANTPKASRVMVPFAVDPDFQLITFSDFVYNLGAGGRYQEPELTLETGVLVRDFRTNAFDHYRAAIRFRAGTDYAVARRPDVQLNITCDFDDNNRAINIRTLEADAVARANYYLAGMAIQYFPQAAESVSYNNIMAIGLDGAITQVTWSVGANGPTTQASRNSEHDVYVPPYPARRRAENLRPAEWDRLQAGANPQRMPVMEAPRG